MRFADFNLGSRLTRRGSMDLEAVGYGVSTQSRSRSHGLSTYLMSEINAKGC